MRILVTGTAGFIGNHLALRLLERGDHVIGVDNLNSYYDVRLKEARLDRVKSHAHFIEERIGIEDRIALREVFSRHAPERVIHLAAQAGVRYSVQNPDVYIDSNLVGFANVLEGCRHSKVEHLVYASSSSVYGLNSRYPYSVHSNVDHPISLYAATKKSNELMAHSYSHLYGLPMTGLRLFTVYGPWGRPDMALFLFTKAILEGRPIDVYNNGEMQRDFTYVADIVECLIRVLDKPATPSIQWSGDSPDPATSPAPHRLYNVGNHNPVKLLNMIDVLERCLGKKAIKNFRPIQAGDVPVTYADVNDLVRDFGFSPSTSIDEGVKRFVDWYRHYYQ